MERRFNLGTTNQISAFMSHLSSHFPEQLPGFDVAFGLKQCIGDQDLLVQLANRFWEDYAGFGAALESDTDPANQMKRIHELKGVSINLGFNDLSEMCARLRLKLNGGSHVEAEEWARFRQELETVGSSIKTLDSQHRS